MPPDFDCHEPGPRNSSWQGVRCTSVVSRSFEHDADDGTIWLVSTPNLKENTLMVIKGIPPLFPFQQPHREDLRLDGYLEQ
ncbi:hypothetical protein TNCV_2007041 [Trichonephila clavipes]|nr:hypothetical protein TNCV_2007041 [Trichonephila clavipes]